MMTYWLRCRVPIGSVKTDNRTDNRTDRSVILGQKNRPKCSVRFYVGIGFFSNRTETDRLTDRLTDVAGVIFVLQEWRAVPQ